jgi:serine/threonine-protein kinase SRK2
MGACASSLGSGLKDLEDTYEVIKPLGEGVEGKVYLCKHKTTNELVAVKLVERGIDGEQRKRLQREIQLQARLFHVNIAELQQVLLSRKHLGIVMEYAPGGTLWDFCQK